MSNKKITKLNEYFYMTPEGEIINIKNIVLLMIVKNWLHIIILVKKNYYIVMTIN